LGDALSGTDAAFFAFLGVAVAALVLGRAEAAEDLF